MPPRIRATSRKKPNGRPRCTGCDPAAADPDAEYVRRAYDRAIDWYKVAESKAQLLLTVIGLLVTVFLGLLTGKMTRPAPVGVETRAFLLVSATAVIAAVTCAAAGLWSRHAGNIEQAFRRLRIDPADPRTYRPEVLWYFGHLARLNHQAAAGLISKADRQFEITALSYNLVNLSTVVLRKHRLVNPGWALTAAAIIAAVVAGTGLYLRA